MKSFFLFLFMLPIFCFGQTDWQKPFTDCNVQGSITIYDFKKNKWYFSDSSDAKKETLPASTFKIINSCIALEKGAVADENEMIKWDGKEKTFFGTRIESWNADTDMKNAYKNSTIWFYVELAKRIGRKKYKKYLTACNYGNLNFSEKGTDFWNYGSFAITPVNQIEFLKAFYKEQLPFSKRTYEIVKRIMQSQKTDSLVMRDKTGWTKSAGIDIGWHVGYVERHDNVYFFATRITKSLETGNPDFSTCRKKVTETILRQLKIIE